MAFGLLLSDAQNDVINLASIDGKTGANARHPLASITRDLNREYRNLRNRVSRLRYKAFLETVQPGALPGRLAGEDFIEIPMLATQSELIGIDVQIANQWHPLAQIEFEQRRNLEFVGNSLLFPFLNSTLAQPDAVGVYAIHKAPKISGDGLSIVAGAIAVWPTTLTGQYQMHSVTSWVDITGASQLFLLYEGWDAWLVNKTAMTICGRDGPKKRDRYAACKEAWQYADRLIKDNAPPVERQGYAIPNSYSGILL